MQHWALFLKKAFIPRLGQLVSLPGFDLCCAQPARDPFLGDFVQAVFLRCGQFVNHWSSLFPTQSRKPIITHENGESECYEQEFNHAPAFREGIASAFSLLLSSGTRSMMSHSA